MENKEENGIVVPFTQNAEFYYRRACRYLEENNELLAVQYARRAYSMDPQDVEYAITLAETLNQIHRYDDSIRVLLTACPVNEMPSDALFGLASNFMGLEEFQAAGQCAEICLQKEKNGPYADRAMDLLDLLDDREDLEYQIGLAEGEDINLLEQIRYAKAMQFSENPDKAISLLEKLTDQYPESDILDMEIAMAMFSAQEYQPAEQRLFRIFQRNSRHIRAHLLMALLYHAEGRNQEAEEELSRTVIDPDASPEELGYAGAVFIEFDKIDRAVDSLERLRKFLPYDKDMLHELAFCYLRQNKRELAEETYRILFMSDESDTVARYYENAIRTEEEDAFLNSWSLHYDVPINEFLRRQAFILDIAKEGADGIKKAWENDSEFKELLQWALFSHLVTFKKAVIQILSLINDDETERMLRQFIIAFDQNDQEKQFAFGSLLSREAKPPFAVNIGGKWQYGSVSPVSIPERLPKSYEYILMNIRSLKEKAKSVSENQAAMIPNQAEEIGTQIFMLYLNTLEGRYPVLTPMQREAMSAAFVLLAVNSMNSNVEIPPEMICGWYGVSRLRLENALERIFSHLQGGEK